VRVIALRCQSLLLFAQLGGILLLGTRLRNSPLVLELRRLLLGDTHLLVETLFVFGRALLFLLRAPLLFPR
jgi:hypothetical protein